MESRRMARGAVSSRTMAATPGALHARAGQWTFAEMRPQDLRQVLAIERSSFDNPWSSALFLQELRIPFSRIFVVRPAGGADEPIVGYLCRWFVAVGGGLTLANPVIAASGTFGYGVEFAGVTDLAALGAVVVKGLSLEPSAGHPAPRLVETAAGMMNAIGLQNIGVRAFVETKLP